MPSRAKKSKDRDFFVNARRVVEQAIGEQMDGRPLEKEPPKNEAAVALSKLGAAKGGKARAAKLSSAHEQLLPRKRPKPDGRISRLVCGSGTK